MGLGPGATALLAGASLAAGFAVAELTGVRALGGIVLLAAVLAGGLAGGTGCGRAERAAEAGPDGPVRLVYWSSQNPQERALADTLVAAINQAITQAQTVAAKKMEAASGQLGAMGKNLGLPF